MRTSIRKTCLSCLQIMRRRQTSCWIIRRRRTWLRAESIGDMSGGIPLLLQWDERWGYAIYRDNMIAINGCGPTALAMVAAGLTGDAGITPDRVARYAAEQGYYEGDAGTSWTLMTEGAAAFGVIGQEIGAEQGTGLCRTGERASGHLQHAAGRFYVHWAFHCPCGNRGRKDPG